MRRLRGWRERVAVVTGASSGIGAELARALARRGSRVALVARRRERLERLAEEIAAAGGSASVHPCDVARRADVVASAEEILARCGRIDLLVNNAGYGRHVLFKDHDLEDVERMLRTNFLGAVYWIKAVLPAMRTRREGWIVNVSSFAGTIGQPDEATYSATKFALSGLSQALAAELPPLGVHVLCVHPVLVRTEMFTPEVMARMPPQTRGSFIEPDRFAAETLRALERGESEVTIPRRFGWVPVLRALWPGPMGRAIARVKLAPLSDLEA